MEDRNEDKMPVTADGVVYKGVIKIFKDCAELRDPDTDEIILVCHKIKGLTRTEIHNRLKKGARWATSVRRDAVNRLAATGLSFVGDTWIIKTLRPSPKRRD